MPNKISCLVFDYDGVLANTDSGRYKILKNILKEYDPYLAESFTIEDIVGLSTKGFLKKKSPKLSQLEIDEIVNKRYDLFFKNLSKYCIPFNGMKKTIKYFSSKFTLAIASTSHQNNLIVQLDYLGVTEYFKWILGRNITENKNFEKTYELIPSIIDMSISECIVIEDSNFGVNAAVKKGFYCIRFDPNGLSLNGSENERVDSYAELRERINKKTTRPNNKDHCNE